MRRLPIVARILGTLVIPLAGLYSLALRLQGASSYCRVKKWPIAPTTFVASDHVDRGRQSVDLVFFSTASIAGADHSYAFLLTGEELHKKTPTQKNRTRGLRHLICLTGGWRGVTPAASLDYAGQVPTLQTAGCSSR